MAVVLEHRREVLRLGGIGSTHEVAGPSAGEVRHIRRKPGVLDFEDVPAGANVIARVDWPHGLVDDGRGARAVGALPAGVLQSYAFELAPFPTVQGLPVANTPQSLKRFVIGPAGGAGGGGPVQHIQFTPAFAAFAPAQVGTLVQAGKLPPHMLPMPGQSAATPALSPHDRNILRLRWTGTAVPAAGATQGPDGGVGFAIAATTITRNDGGDWTTDFAVGDYVQVTLAGTPANNGVWGPITNITTTVLTIASGGLTPDAADNTGVFEPVSVMAVLAAATSAEGFAWPRGVLNLVPGSIRITLPTSGLLMRDDGYGRLVTVDGQAAYAGDGVVDYTTGAWRIFNFGVAETGNLLVAYEHDCAYEELDVQLAWDALMSQ